MGLWVLIAHRTECQGSIFRERPRLSPTSQRVCDPGKCKRPQHSHPSGDPESHLSHQRWVTSDKPLSLSEAASSPVPISLHIPMSPPHSQGSQRWAFRGWNFKAITPLTLPQRLTRVNTLGFLKRRLRFREAPRGRLPLASSESTACGAATGPNRPPGTAEWRQPSSAWCPESHRPGRATLDGRVALGPWRTCHCPLSVDLGHRSPSWMGGTAARETRRLPRPPRGDVMGSRPRSGNQTRTDKGLGR